MLDPHQLRIFLVAAETLNFTRAADRLHMSQPSVTQHIQLLETQLGTELFVRTGRKIQLTDSGQALIPLARQIVTLSLRTEEVLGALQQEVAGKLIIACSTTPGKYILPVLLAEFMRRYPMVEAACEVHPRTTALEMLEQGRVHIALSSSIEEFDPNIEFQKFISDPVVLIAPLEHPWAHRQQIQPAELLNAKYIMREQTAGTYRVVRSSLINLGININNLNTIMTVGNSEAIAIAVQQGVGVGFVSKAVVDNMVGAKVAIVNIPGMYPCQDIYLCRHRLQPFSNLQTAFWEYASQKN